jgi:hypothetical protein
MQLPGRTFNASTWQAYVTSTAQQRSDKLPPLKGRM